MRRLRLLLAFLSAHVGPKFSGTLGIVLGGLLGYSLASSPAEATTGLCAAGRSCRVRNLVTTTPAFATAIQLPVNTFLSFGSATIRDTGATLLLGSEQAYPVQMAGGLVVRSTQVDIGGHVANEGALSSTVPTRALIGEGTANQIFRSDGSRYSRILSGAHPMREQPTFIIDVGRGANTPEWQYAPKNTGGTAISVSESCVSGTLAAGGRLTRYNGRTASTRSKTTQASANAICTTTTAIIGKTNNLRPNLHTVVTLPDSLTSVRWLCGLGPDSIFSGPADTPASVEGVWFRFSSSASDTNLMGCVANGTTTTCTSTGQTAVAGAARDLEIDFSSETSAVTFWVDGVPRLRVTSGLPPGSADVEFGCVVQTLSAATRSFTHANTSLEMSL